MAIKLGTQIWLGAAAMMGLLACQPEVDPGGGKPGTGGSGGGGGTAPAGQGGSGPGSGATGGVGGNVGSGGGTGGSGGSAAAGGSGGSGTGTGGSGTGGSGTGGSGTGGPSSDASGASGDGAASETAVGEGGQSAGPSAGCGRMNPAGTFMITAGAATTPYRVVLPTGYDANKPYPLVFYLHGRGNNIEGQGNLTRDVAGANLGIVVYPKSFGGSGWEVPNRDRPEENVALLRALIKHLGGQYCVDTRKVVMTGFSSGCWFASRLACTMKDELAGVVAAACGLDPMGRCPDHKPITYIIGRGDGAFSGAPAAAEFYRTRNACQMTSKPASTAPCQLYDGCAAGSPTNYCPHPGGHQWPAFASKSVVEMLEKL